MKITVMSMEIPYPPIHGGRVDIWRRLKTLSKLGVEVQLICWTKSLPSSEDVEVIQQYVQKFYPIVYKKNLAAKARRFIDLFSYSLEVSSRIVRGKDWTDLLTAVKEFQPDVIMADHVHPGVVALPLSHQLGIPMIVRSHDIGHIHYRNLMKTAKGHRKIVRFLSQNHMESYETRIFRESLAFYDISLDDLAYWRSKGLTNGYHLPPIIEFTDQDHTSINQSTETAYDVVFLGNLVTENNVAGVIWFLQEVLPILKQTVPTIKVLIAGSNPTPQVKALCESLRDNVDLKINPPNASQIYRSGKVLINPIWTGTGVSIKSIDMLAAGRPIVSFSKGLAGLPEEMKAYFKVVEDASSFAASIINYLNDNNYQAPDKELLDSLLGTQAIQNFINQLNKMLAEQQTYTK